MTETSRNPVEGWSLSKGIVYALPLLMMGLGLLFLTFFEDVVPHLSEADIWMQSGLLLFFLSAGYLVTALAMLFASLRVDEAPRTTEPEKPERRFRRQDAASHVIMSLLLILVSCGLITLSLNL